MSTIHFLPTHQTENKLRSHYRYEYSVDVFVRPLRGGQSMLLESRNISPMGIFLNSPLLFDLGTEFILDFPLPDGSWTRSLAQITRHDREPGAGGMGLRFSLSGRIEEQKLHNLMHLKQPVA